MASHPNHAATALRAPLGGSPHPSNPAVRAPSKWLMLREISVFASMVNGRFAVGRLARQFAPGCDGRPVMLLPGFLSTPMSMFVLREVLQRTGYRNCDWGLGRNLGVRADTLERLTAIVRAHADTCGAPVTLIGWSLGGIYARELAKVRPELVSEILTLGSPFSAGPRANNAWWLYERIAGHAVDAPPVAAVISEKPPVPTTAFWSRRDGVVAPASAHGAADERDRAVELDCGHLGFASKPSALLAILTHLQAGNA